MSKLIKMKKKMLVKSDKNACKKVTKMLEIQSTFYKGKMQKKQCVTLKSFAPDQFLFVFISVIASP